MTSTCSAVATDTQRAGGTMVTFARTGLMGLARSHGRSIDRSVDRFPSGLRRAHEQTLNLSLELGAVRGLRPVPLGQHGDDLAEILRIARFSFFVSLLLQQSIGPRSVRQGETRRGGNGRKVPDDSPGIPNRGGDRLAPGFRVAGTGTGAGSGSRLFFRQLEVGLSTKHVGVGVGGCRRRDGGRVLELCNHGRQVPDLLLVLTHGAESLALFHDLARGDEYLGNGREQGRRRRDFSKLQGAGLRVGHPLQDGRAVSRLDFHVRALVAMRKTSGCFDDNAAIAACSYEIVDRLEHIGVRPLAAVFVLAHADDIVGLGRSEIPPIGGEEGKSSYQRKR
mmetsp:Transcript_22580/g.62839  ORF Transcript_22580/g.62839 Transcript_22580/m.62839 type:complete len:336 (-) Transcript_22580:202-1209(-)